MQIATLNIVSSSDDMRSKDGKGRAKATRRDER